MKRFESAAKTPNEPADSGRSQTGFVVRSRLVPARYLPAEYRTLEASHFSG